MSSFIIRKKIHDLLFSSQTILFLIACHRNVLRVHSLVRMDLMEDFKLDFLSLGNARASVCYLHSTKTNVLIHHPID